MQNRRTGWKDRVGWMRRGWKERLCQPRVGHGAGGNIKGRGNDSWGPIIRFGSRRDASEAIYLPLPLLISCDVPPSLDSFPLAFLLASREAATFLHNVRTCSFFLSDRNDTANVSVKNSNGTREREGGGSIRRPISSRRVEALSRGCLPRIHPVVARFSPPIHATHRGTHERSERSL